MCSCSGAVRGGLELSAAGRKLLPQALEAEASLRQGFNAVRGLDSEAAGRIRLSVDPMTAHFLPAPVLGEFLSLYPDIHIEMNLSYAIDSIDKLETDVSIRHVRELSGDAVGRKLFPLSIGGFCVTRLHRRGICTTPVHAARV